MDARIDFRDVMCAAGFEEDCVSGIAQDRHQRQHVLLQQRLATGDFDQRTAKRRHGIDDFFQCLLFPFVKCVLRIAIVAAKIAEGQPHEDARPPHPGALALNRMINLVNRQRLFVFWHAVIGLDRSLGEFLNVLRDQSQRKFRRKMLISPRYQRRQNVEEPQFLVW